MEFPWGPGKSQAPGPRQPGPRQPGPKPPGPGVPSLRSEEEKLDFASARKEAAAKLFKARRKVVVDPLC